MQAVNMTMTVRDGATDPYVAPVTGYPDRIGPGERTIDLVAATLRHLASMTLLASDQTVTVTSGDLAVTYALADDS